MEVERKEKDGRAGNEIYKKGFGGRMKDTRIYVERRDIEEKVKRKSGEKAMEVRGKIEGKKEKRQQGDVWRRRKRKQGKGLQGRNGKKEKIFRGEGSLFKIHQR